ncbi:glycosyltransferase family 4 protein [Demequina lutea]|uniref:D-inositol 3-phosphate glycosyltransferase n=1 Tax=Demequina lutea TaxID=431489 RepID=A0A7Y9ZBL8_9MICO|nr:glycosyltransferase family 4 protein [Demequina lutea]NYI42384.1 phosphatidylinositol alpha-mannosyltransferase [Demequina lutea]
MKIALVIDDALARPDGVQEYVRTIGRAMGERGHEVHVLCSGDAGEAPAGIARVVSLTDNVGVTFNGNGLRTPRPASRRRLREHLAAERYDVIHVQTPHSPFFAARVVRQARRMQGTAVRIVATFHILPDGAVSEWATRALGLTLRRNLRLFDAFAAVSAPAAAFAKRAFGIDAAVIPNAVRVDDIAAQASAKPWPADPAGRTIIAFLGRLVERKGAVELVEAFAMLPPRVRGKVALRIGGRGPLASRIEGLIAQHELEGSVTLEGFISDEDKPGFMAAADLAVFPAIGGESFGIVLTEAMAAGSGAVLGGDNPGYAWTLDNPDAVVNPRDTGAFAARLGALLTDSDARAVLHAQQTERVKDFDVAVVAERVAALYARG